MFQKCPTLSCNNVEYCLNYNSVCYAVLSRTRDPSVFYNPPPPRVVWVLHIPCPPPLICDRLFGISSLHQLDPLIGAQRGLGSAGMQDRERWGCVGGPPSLLCLLTSHVCVSHSKVNLFHLPPAQSLQHPYFERTNGRNMQRSIYKRLLNH